MLLILYLIVYVVYFSYNCFKKDSIALSGTNSIFSI